MDYHKINLNEIQVQKININLGKNQEQKSLNYKVTYKGEPLKIETPIVNFPFGIEYHNKKYKISAEINERSNFLKFIRAVESKTTGQIEEIESDRDLFFISNLKIDYKNYSPLLTSIKIPFRYGKMETAFSKRTTEFFSSSDLQKNNKGRMVIKIQNLWISEDDNYGILWQAEKINILE